MTNNTFDNSAKRAAWAAKRWAFEAVGLNPDNAEYAAAEAAYAAAEAARAAAAAAALAANDADKEIKL